MGRISWLGLGDVRRTHFTRSYHYRAFASICSSWSRRTRWTYFCVVVRLACPIWRCTTRVRQLRPESGHSS